MIFLSCFVHFYPIRKGLHTENAPTYLFADYETLESPQYRPVFSLRASINPLNAELNPIRHFLALLRAHHFVHVSRIRVKLHLRGSHATVRRCDARERLNKAGSSSRSTPIAASLRKVLYPSNILTIDNSSWHCCRLAVRDTSRERCYALGAS
jgi:hypothetical protein